MELEFAQKILKKFKLNDAVISIREHKLGLIHQTFEIWTQNKPYILQEINTRVFPNYLKGLENIILVKEWLKKTNYSYEFPSPLLNQYLNFKEKVWRLQPFVVNTESLNKVSKIKEVNQAVRCLGEFYNCLEDFPIEKLNITIPNFHGGAQKISAFNKALKNSNELKKQNAWSLILETKRNLKILAEWDEICRKLPKRVIHYDAKINNFLFKKNTTRVIALIDLDTLMPGCVLSDIGDMIRTYSNPVGEESKDVSKVTCNKNIVAAIVNGFKSALTHKEIEYLNFGGQAITFMQAVRFLTDYLNNDIYYNTFYENQNLVRAKNQFKLYRSLKGLRINN